jgi:chemotaxis protein MotB
MANDHPPSEESYFVSMTDMLVGMLFIFLILLMYFALQLIEQRETNEENNNRLKSSADSRTLILKDLEDKLLSKDIKVTVDLSTGVLRLPNEILFGKGSADVSSKGEEALRILAASLQEVLPCYTESGRREPSADCLDTPDRIEALFIEGHTDSDPIAPGFAFRDNWDLSTARATATYRKLVTAQPGLEDLSSTIGEKPQPILSVAGYADRRPVIDADNEEAKSKNRRIDLRLIMVSPRPDAIKDMDRQMIKQP